MAYALKKYVGRSVVMEYALGTPNALPAAADWKRFGAMRTKSFSAPWDTVDATADDTVGYVREMLATYQTLTVSGDGTLLTGEGNDAVNLKNLTKHFFNPSTSNGQPVAWFRLTFPDLTFTTYMLISDLSREAPNDEIATYSFEATATASDFGLIVEDTPAVDAPAVVSVTAVPDTISVEEGETYDLEYIVLPADADNRVTWASDDEATVTVNAVTGVITGVAAGTATVTVTSTDDPTKSDDVAVTVTAP